MARVTCYCLCKFVKHSFLYLYLDSTAIELVKFDDSEATEVKTGHWSIF